MSICKVCSKEIPRGKIYRGLHYKNLPFCSEKCYNEFMTSKQKKSKEVNKTPPPATPTPDPVQTKQLVKLRDYINELWDEINWPWMMRQIKSMCEEYELNYNDLYLVIKYAIIYENYCVDQQYGLGQFVKFIEPSKRFAEQIENNKKLAEKMPKEITIKVKPHKQTKYIKEEEWD